MNVLMIKVHDLLLSAAILAAVVGVTGLLYTGLDGMPGFVWGLLIAIGGGTWEHARKCPRGHAERKVLAGMSKAYLRTSFFVVLVAAIAPVLAPASAYEKGGWIVWVDGVMLIGALMAVPIAYALLAVASVVARRRPFRADRI